jgi:hypothetical protein
MMDRMRWCPYADSRAADWPRVMSAVIRSKIDPIGLPAWWGAADEGDTRAKV